MFGKEFNDKLDKTDSSVSFLTRFERLKEQLTQIVPPTTVPGNQDVDDTEGSGTSSDTPSGEEQTPVQYQEDTVDEPTE